MFYTDFRLSWRFIINVNLALGSLDCVEVGSVPGVLVIHAGE